MLKQLKIFLVALLLNCIWESLHSRLYLHYNGGPITQKVILLATLADALFVTLIALVLTKIKPFRPLALGMRS